MAKPKTVRVNMNLPEKVLQYIDSYAERNSINRSVAVTLMAIQCEEKEIGMNAMTKMSVAPEMIKTILEQQKQQQNILDGGTF